MPSVFDWLKTKKKQLRKKSGIKFSPTAKAVTIAIMVVFVLLILRYAVQIIHPFIWAILTAYLFAPLIFSLERRTKIHRVVWILLAYLLIGIILIWAVKYAFPIINNEVSELFGVGNTNTTSFIGHISDLGKGKVLGYEINIGDTIDKFQAWLREQAETFAVPVFFAFIERLILISAYLVITFYLLLDGEKYIRLFLLLFPTKYRREITNVAQDINETMGAYIRGQVILIFIMSFASWVILSTLRVHYSLVLCLTTGILEVVPIIGPIAATALAAIVAFNQPIVGWGLTNVTLTMIVIAAYFMLRQIEDLIVIPNIVGKFIHVHPVVVLFALFIGGRVGGVLGIFLALPVSAVLKVLLNYLYPKLAG
jgi:predicted PurR-regulated permease PerM